MRTLAKAHDEPDALRRRALTQAGRELLLAQSSDWAFIMKTGTTVEYAVRRTRDHLHAFERLDLGLSDRAPLDSAFEVFLRGREAQFNLFPTLDYRHWAS